MAFINASLWDGTTSWLHGSVQMTVGLTLSNNTISTNPEFVFGPSLSFLRDRLFLTGGVYAGFQESLANGYTLGGPAPSGSIPTLNQLHWKPGFAISWRTVSASKAKDTGNGQQPSMQNNSKKGKQAGTSSQ